MTHVAKKFDVLNEIWQVDNKITKRELTTKSYPLCLAPQLKEIYFLWPMDDRVYFLTQEGIFSYPEKSQYFVPHVVGREKYLVFYYGLNCLKEGKGKYLKPFITEEVCFQPLTSIRNQPLWVNLYQLEKIEETMSGLCLTFPFNNQCLLDYSLKSFSTLLHFSAKVYGVYLRDYERRLVTENFFLGECLRENFFPWHWVDLLLQGQKEYDRHLFAEKLHDNVSFTPKVKSL